MFHAYDRRQLPGNQLLKNFVVDSDVISSLLSMPAILAVMIQGKEI